MNEQVSNYILLAEECLRDAQHLLQNKSYRRSLAGHAYYAFFDAVRTLLATKNVSSKSHSSIKMLFGDHFVRTDPFTKADAKDFHKLFLLRQDSDYETDETISEEAAAEFLLQVEAYLRSISANS